VRNNKYLGVWLSIPFFLTGGYILQDSIHNSGKYAEEWILLGALFSGLALVAMGWSIKLHGLAKAMQRHMRGE
jgi:hypothetical protein